MYRASAQILDEDYSKAAFLCADRSVTLHAKFGAYYRTRIPKAGRGLAYAPFTAGAEALGTTKDLAYQHPASKHACLQLCICIGDYSKQA